MGFPEEVGEGSVGGEFDEGPVARCRDGPVCCRSAGFRAGDRGERLEGGEGPLGDEGEGDVDGGEGRGREKVDDRLDPACSNLASTTNNSLTASRHSSNVGRGNTLNKDAGGSPSCPRKSSDLDR